MGAVSADLGELRAQTDAWKRDVSDTLRRAQEKEEHLTKHIVDLKKDRNAVTATFGTKVDT
eukprot:10838693-Lingulodinium_polyedra.AAC.1